MNRPSRSIERRKTGQAASPPDPGSARSRFHRGGVQGGSRPLRSQDPRRPGWILAPGLVLVGMLCACAATPTSRTVPPYPVRAERKKALDVVVERRGDAILLTNRTARAYRNVRLWLNHQYVDTVKRISIGGGNRFKLARFVNRYGERYPTGTLLSPEENRTVLSAQIQNPRADTLRALLVLPPEEEKPTGTGSLHRRPSRGSAGAGPGGRP